MKKCLILLLAKEMQNKTRFYFTCSVVKIDDDDDNDDEINIVTVWWSWNIKCHNLLNFNSLNVFWLNSSISRNPS